jgi:hypothetical protein
MPGGGDFEVCVVWFFPISWSAAVAKITGGSNGAELGAERLGLAAEAGFLPNSLPIWSLSDHSGRRNRPKGSCGLTQATVSTKNDASRRQWSKVRDQSRSGPESRATPPTYPVDAGFAFDSADTNPERAPKIGTRHQLAPFDAGLVLLRANPPVYPARPVFGPPRGRPAGTAARARAPCPWSGPPRARQVRHPPGPPGGPR